MKNDKKRIFVVCFVLPLLSLIPIFAPSDLYKNILLAFACVCITLVANAIIRKKGICKHQKRTVAFLMGLTAILAVAIFFILGIKFGFYRNPFTAVYIWKYILPYVAIVFSTEILRRILLAQSIKAIKIASFFFFIMIECIMQLRQGAFSRFDQFVSLVGITLFPAVTANILCHYISARYGAAPNIAYRTIMLLWQYVTPVMPNIPELLRSFVLIILPLAIMLFVSKLYQQRNTVSISRRRRRLGRIAFIGAIAFALMVIMLISCTMKYGLIIIGSPSMTGAIDTGDGIIYRSYEGEVITIGTIIVYDHNDMRVVHRVIDIKNINGQLRYFTKGDANDSADPWFVTSDRIVGTVVLTLKYIGLPTVTLKSLF